MKKTMNKMLRAVFSALACASVLAACGGSDSATPASQNRQHSRSEKAQASDYQKLVQQLYVSYFGRPADPAGLANFEAALLAAGAPTDIPGLLSASSTNAAVASLINSFGSSLESRNLYGSGDTAAFVTAVFENVLNRAPQPDGLAYWVGAINDGSLSQGAAALAIMSGALTNGSAQGQIDAQLVNNRLATAAYFTAQLSSQNQAQSYVGEAAAASARTMLSSIGATTSVSDGDAAADGNISNLEASGIFLLAGDLGTPYDYGAGASIKLVGPNAVAVDSAGNVYVADQTNTVRKITQAGVMTILAGTPGVSGSADGTGAAASFKSPYGLAVDGAGNVYVADSGNSTIRRITPAGVVTTIAGQAGSTGFTNGVGSSALFNMPTGVAVDPTGNVYVADPQNLAIRKIDPSGTVTTFASNRPGEIVGSDGQVYVSLSNQFGIAVDNAGNVYVANTIYCVVVKITPAGKASLVAGIPSQYGLSNGSALSSTFEYPSMLAVDGAGNIYVGDNVTDTLRKISASGTVTSIGTAVKTFGYLNGPGQIATFDYMEALAVDKSGNVYVADGGNNVIREIDSAGDVTTFAGPDSAMGAVDGTGAAATFDGPSGVAVDGAGNTYVADTLSNLIRKITPGGAVTTLAGTAGVAGSSDGVGALATFNQPNGVAVDSAGNVYVADTGNKTIRKISSADVVSTFAGKAGVTGSADGTGDAASFTSPNGVAVDASGNVYVADLMNNTVRKISPTGVVTTFAGTAGVSGSADGVGGAASFMFPTDVAVDSAGNIYLSDQCVIRKITPGAAVTTLAGKAGVCGSNDGTGAAAQFFYQIGLTVDAAGNVYVADGGGSTIRKITPAGVVSTVVGTPGQPWNSVYTTVLGHLPGEIAVPSFIAIDAAGTLYVTSSNDAIFKIKLP